MNYTLHSMRWEGDTVIDEPMNILASLDILELFKAVADDYQVRANRADAAIAYQIRGPEGTLVYWTSCTHPYWR